MTKTAVSKKWTRSISWNGKYYTSSSRVPAQVTAPTLGTPSMTSDGASITFSGGSGYTTLIPQYSSNAGSTWASISNDTTSPLTFTGLAAGNYSFRALADGSVATNVVTGAVASASALFSDSFASNDFSHTENGIAWLAATANTAVTGNKLQFTYPARAMGSDGWSEQRLYYIKKAGNPLSEIWVKYDIEIPANYYHRDDTVDHNNVNKFLTFYARNYGDGFEARFDLQAGSSGQSLIQYSVYINQVEISAYTTSAIAIATADFGTTISLIARVKTETSNGSNDGVMQIWKKAQGAGSYTKLHERMAGSSYLNMGNLWGGASKNYIDEIYFWGWANSGFTNETIINIDNVVVSDANLWGVS